MGERKVFFAGQRVMIVGNDDEVYHNIKYPSIGIVARYVGEGLYEVVGNDIDDDLPVLQTVKSDCLCTLGDYDAN